MVGRRQFLRRQEAPQHIEVRHDIVQLDAVQLCGHARENNLQIQSFVQGGAKTPFLREKQLQGLLKEAQK